MKSVIIGPGSIGCLMATFLEQGREKEDQLVLVDHDAARAASISQHGIRCNEGEEELSLPVPATTDKDAIFPPDILIFAVKSYTLPEAIRTSQSLLKHQPLVLLMQNGIAHLHEDIRHQLDNPVYVTTTEGATLLGPGHIRHAGKGITHMGFLQPEKDTQKQCLFQLMARLRKAGMQICHDTDISVHIWQKLLINCCINPMTVLYDCKNGELLANRTALSSMQTLYRETQEVAQAQGITLASDFTAVLDVCRKTENNISSMLQDIRKNRPTEIEAINGAVVVLAQKWGIPVPHTLDIVNQIRKIQHTQQKDVPCR